MTFERARPAPVGPAPGSPGLICWSGVRGDWGYYDGDPEPRDTSDDLGELIARWPLAAVHVQAALFGQSLDEAIAADARRKYRKEVTP